MARCSASISRKVAKSGLAIIVSRSNSVEIREPGGISFALFAG